MSNSSDSSDPSNSSDPEDSDYPSDSTLNEENSTKQKSTTNNEIQKNAQNTSDYTSDDVSSTEPNQNTKNSSSEINSTSEKEIKSQVNAKSDSDSDSKSNESSDSEEKSSDQKNEDTNESNSESDSESRDSAASDEKLTTNKEVKSEPKSDSKSTSDSQKSSDSESVPVVKNATVNPTNEAEEKKSKEDEQQKSTSDLESINKTSTTSDDDSKNVTNSDSESEPEAQRSSKSSKRTDDSLQAKEKSTTISTQKEKTQDSKKSTTKDDKSSVSPKKSKKSAIEEKGNSKSSKRRSKMTEDTKDDENASKKQKKSQSNAKKSRHISRKTDTSDNNDDYEYDSDSENDNHRQKNSSKSKNGEPTSQMSAEELDEAFEREDAIIEAVYQFNSRKNVSKLCAYYNTEETPEGIAHVIRTTKGLNGEIIGDYLGKKENSKILSAYFMEVDMKCGYIEAMRRSLSGPMFLPGEGQIIDRILQEFANCYVQQNPGKYSNPDELYVLSFALVMLNSDLHNRNVQNRMTVKEFIRNTRHLLSAADVTDKELTEMYNEIQSTPFSFTNHSNDFWWEVAPKIRGYLQKRSEHSLSKWTKKYFVLTNSCLYYFKDDNPANEGKPLGVIQLTEVEVNADTKDPLMIKITATNDEISYVKFKKIPKAVKGIKKISFKAQDRASASRWLHRIKKSAIMSNFLNDKMNENNAIGQKM